MLSRVAESIYWLNRYIERAENVARFVDVELNLMLDRPTHTVQQWEALLVTTGHQQSFRERCGEATAENIIQFLTFDRDANSIVSCLQLARESARSIRQFISRELWQQVNEFYLMVEGAAPRQSLSELQEFLTAVRVASYLLSGVMDATMSHDEGWHFGKLGRLLERMDRTSCLLNARYFMLLPATDDTIDELGWMALLKSVSAYEMYRKSDRHQITATGVAKFLILDREFPRSIQFCLQQAEESLHQITGTSKEPWSSPTERSLGRLRSYLNYLTIEDILQIGLHEFLDNLQQQTNDVGDKIVEDFFSLV